MPKLQRPDGRVVSVSKAGVPALLARGYTDLSAPPPTSVERPAKTATRQAWDEYARALGLDPAEFSSKADLIDAAEVYADD